MKTSMLKNLELNAKRVLSRNELKTILAGQQLEDDEQCPQGGIPCSCTNNGGGITVGCASSIEACFSFC
ncbi:hypothetical protein [Aquimarina algicola]|uniref:Bacteriocin n=1 Tax=Aquimarina algicola TaxID=2589995 RepID=A0A504J559_9FLAO|nr:hypothetical protein [Aquimarina algicola]TPN85937.1 hypothetical protein FHK87_11695 [Aquimarina algicola]